MRLLVLGGNRFLGREVAEQGIRRGWEVTCAARGSSGSFPPAVDVVNVDREVPGGLAGLQGDFDVAVDVARRPSHVRSLLAEMSERVGHWVFVSSISVYADEATPGSDARAEIVPPLVPGADEAGPASFAPAKVSCELAFRQAVAGRLLTIRPGVMVGPRDESDRFVYWVNRLARGGRVLAPGGPDDSVQCVDVRDLTAFLLDAVERRVVGTLDGVAPAIPRRDFLTEIARGLGTEPELTWVDQEILLREGVAPWNGPRSLPFWLPLPEHAGVMSRDVSETVGAGLRLRPLSETAADTFAWLAREPRDARLAGLSADDERALLCRHSRVLG